MSGCFLRVSCGAKTSIKTSMRWSVFLYLSGKRNRKFKHLVQTKPMGENTITNRMKVSVAGTSIKKERKKFKNHCARKKKRKLKKATIVSSELIANVTGHRGINILKDYDEADEEELR